MTTKDLLEITGCSRKTINRFVAKMFPGIAVKGRTTVYTEDQGIALIKALPKSNVVQMYQVPGTNVPSVEARVDRLEAMVERLCVSIASLIPSQAAKSPTQIEAPKMTERAEIRRIVATFAKTHGEDHSAVWGMLYGAAYYRLGINLSARSKHSGKSGLEIAEDDGRIAELVAIAREVLK